MYHVLSVLIVGRFFVLKYLAVCVRNFRHNNNPLFSHEGSCALERTAAAPQFAIGRHKALQQCQEVPYNAMRSVKDEKKTKRQQKSHGNSVIVA